MTAEPVSSTDESGRSVVSWPVPPQQGYTVDDLFICPTSRRTPS